MNKLKKYAGVEHSTIFLMLEYRQQSWRVHVQAFDKTNFSNKFSDFHFYQPAIASAQLVANLAENNPQYEQFL